MTSTPKAEFLPHQWTIGCYAPALSASEFWWNLLIINNKCYVRHPSRSEVGIENLRICWRFSKGGATISRFHTEERAKNSENSTKTELTPFVFFRRPSDSNLRSLWPKYTNLTNRIRKTNVYPMKPIPPVSSGSIRMPEICDFFSVVMNEAGAGTNP